MRAIAIVAVAVALMGCGLKANTFNPDGRGYLENRKPIEGAVCQLDSSPPEGVTYKPVGLIRGNRGSFGGFLPVRQAMADEARMAGADVIFNMRMHQDVAFRGIFILRPVGEGMGIKLDNPESFDCLANGGRLYPGKGMAPIYGHQRAAAASAGTYDECMSRVMRISDPSLRLQAMTTCDGAAEVTP